MLLAISACGVGMRARDVDGYEHSDSSVGTVANVSGYVYFVTAVVASE